MAWTRRAAKGKRAQLEALSASMTDETAAAIPMWAKRWTPDGHFPEGTRWEKDGKLWKSRQTHDGNNDPTRVPGLAPSLWVQVAPAGLGTRDNPMPYEMGMELELGKYYAENGIIYYCNEGLARSDWTLEVLANTVKRYVEVVV